MFTSCLCVWMELSFWTRAWTERELTLVRNPARVCQSRSSALSPSLPVNVCWAGTKYVQQFTCVCLSPWASDVLTRSHTFLVPVAVFYCFPASTKRRTASVLSGNVLYVMQFYVYFVPLSSSSFFTLRVLKMWSAGALAAFHVPWKHIKERIHFCSFHSFIIHVQNEDKGERAELFCCRHRSALSLPNIDKCSWFFRNLSINNS